MRAFNYLSRVMMVAVFGLADAAAARAGEPKPGPWGAPVDGLVCRLTLHDSYVLGQPVTAVIEIKNVSAKKRFILARLDPPERQSLALELVNPDGKRFTRPSSTSGSVVHTGFTPLRRGEVVRFNIEDLTNYYFQLAALNAPPWRTYHRPTLGKYTLKCRFSSPKLPAREREQASAEMLAGLWAHEVASAPVSFQLNRLGKDDLVVHEWGVFTILNDVKYANANRKEEWGSLPSFFYRQFPRQRIRWVPSYWDKPIVFLYTKGTPLHVSVQVMFRDGAPVVWWPAVVYPKFYSNTANDSTPPPPFRYLIWNAWLGDEAPAITMRPPGGPIPKVKEVPLPDGCWLKQARLPQATRLTVVGEIEDRPRTIMGGVRSETERFLYYDGLVPAPEYLRCERVDATSLTLRNCAKFDLARLFVVDRRKPGVVGFAHLDDSTQPFKPGTSLTVMPKPIAAALWPAVGIDRLRRTLRQAGLFDAEAGALINIWKERLFEAGGITVFHIMPAAEYDRMLPLDVLPEPFAKPVRVGIALQPHMEIEPALAARVAALLLQLNDTEFKKRAAASKTLLAIGPMAISILKAELTRAPALEMRRRIQAVLDRVDATEWMRVLPPEKKGKR